MTVWAQDEKVRGLGCIIRESEGLDSFLNGMVGIAEEQFSLCDCPVCGAQFTPLYIPN